MGRLTAIWSDIRSTHIPAVLVALALGTAGGFLALMLGVPLPFMIGALAANTLATLSGFRPFGRPLGLPNWLRNCFVPIIGVAIGAAVTPDLLENLLRWGPSLIAVILFTPIAHFIAYTSARRIGKIDKATALFGTAPGGLIEAVVMGEEAGGNLATLTALQFLRLILCIVLIPLGFWVITGTQVGSAGGAVIGADIPLMPQDWIILGLCAAAGMALGKALRLPAWIITGPILLSGAAHLLGWVEGAPPGWLIAVTQLFIGTSLGGRFAGQSVATLLGALKSTVVSVLAIFALAGLLSWPLAPLVGESWHAVFLAFAPGGVAEMVLIALSLEISVIYVTIHHILRILMAVGLASYLAKRML